VYFDCVVLFLLLSAPADARRGVPAYTNDDLDRVAPRRDETGVNSKPAVAAPAPAPASSGSKGDGRGEEYWRREAERLRERLQPLEERAADLRVKIDQRQRTPGVLPYTDARVRALQRDLATVEAKARDLESRLEERARRAGALPGWLR
jgi:hypothetical protein